MPQLSIGTVSFFNAWPLSFFLADFLPQARIISDMPSRLQQMLLAGEIDLALLSSICLAYNPNLAFMPGMGIASSREVASVNLFINKRLLPGDCPRLIHRGGLGCIEQVVKRLNSIAMDPASNSSNVLLQVLLTSHTNSINCHLAVAESNSVSWRLSNYDGVLLIGDRALSLSKTHAYIDLASWWKMLTGHPFVFALWIGQRQTLEKLPQSCFQDSLDRGLQNKEILITRYIEQIGSDNPWNRATAKRRLIHYLTENIHYRLNNEDLAGLRDYLQKSYELGYAPRLRDDLF